MIKYGIKLWTINKYCFPKAVKLYQDGLIDFVELYVVPDETFKNDLDILRNMPVHIHAPHSLHNFNIFELDKEKIDLFQGQVIELADFFNSKYIILHAGIGNDPKIFRKNIAKIYDKRITIENNPKMGLNDKICFGYSYNQLKFIKEKCKLNICLDINHAIKSAVSEKKDYKKYIKDLFKLNPKICHISDGTLKIEKDEHLGIGDGDYDFNFLGKCLKESNIEYVTMETPNTDLNSLKEYLENLKKLKSISFLQPSPYHFTRHKENLSGKKSG